MTRYTNLDGRRSLAKKLVDSDSEPEPQAEATAPVAAVEAEAGPSTSPPKKKKKKAAKTDDVASAATEEPAQDVQASADAGDEAAQAPTETAAAPPQEPMTVEKLLKRAKLLKLKAKKAKTEEARKKFQKQTREVERQVEEMHGAFEYGPKGQLIKKGDAQSETQWQSRQKQDWAGPSAHGDGGWSGRGGSGFGAGGEGYSNGDERWKMDRRDERREERALDRQKKLKCFACRGMGHSAKDCPNALDAQSISLKAAATSSDTPMMGRDAVGICFRCGSTEHTLARCKKAALPADELPFATCFVCGTKGHLSSKCPNNAGRGVYPEGGSCKVCNSVQHLARDCPIVLRREGASATGTNSIVVGSARESAPGGDEDEFHSQSRKRTTDTAHTPAKKTKVISF